MRALLLSILLIALAGIALAEPKAEIQTSVLPDGTVMTRCITPGTMGIRNDLVQRPYSGLDQEVLWMDEDPTGIAENVAVSGNGTYSAVGWWLNNERVSKYQTTGGGNPLWDYSISPNFKMPVAMSDNGNVIVSCGDVIPMSVWLNGAGPMPSWQFTPPTDFQVNGCDVSDNGTKIALVAKPQSVNEARLFVFNSASATPIFTANFDATNGVNGVVLSEDGAWAVVSTYQHEYVFNVTTASLFWTGTNYGQGMAAIDADAEYLAKGDFNGLLTLYQRTPTGYNQLWTSSFGGWVTAVAISADGSKVMGGNLVFNPYSGIVRAFNISGTQLWQYSQYGDEVAQVAICNDGSVGAAISWGQYGATFGDVFTAFDMATGQVIFRLLDDINEPGSLFGLSLSDDGSYAMAGGKAVHARQMGNGGQVYCIELEEAGPFNVSVTLDPDSLTQVIPAAGGVLEYTIQIVNNEAQAVSFSAWTEARLPNGSTYGPILNRSLTLGAGASVFRAMAQNVPGNAPAGNYQYIAKVGSAGGTVWDQDSFPFTKLGADNTGYRGWGIYGWDEELANAANTISGYSLKQNYPNPFNPETVIAFALPEDGDVSLTVFNVLGDEVAEILSGWTQAGEYSVVFDAGKLPSGIYFYRLQAGNFTQFKKMALVK